MIELLEEIAASVPHFVWVTSIPLAILIGQILFLRAALRQREHCLALEDAAQRGDWTQVAPASALHWLSAAVCGLSVLAIPALAVWSIASARTLLFPGITDGDPSAKAGNVSLGLSGMINAVPWTINMLAPSILLATFSMSLRLSVYRRRQRLAEGARLASSDPGAALAHLAHGQPNADSLATIPLTFLVLGLFPVISGAWAHTMRVLKGFGVMAGLPPEQKGAALLASLDEAHAIFAVRAWLAYPGTAIAILTSAALLMRWKRRQADLLAVKPPELSWKATIFLSASCVIAALALFAIAVPFRAENTLPWLAPRMTGENLRLDLPSAPQLEGPDEIERSPILHQAEQGVALDGYRVDLAGIEDDLRTLRRNFQLLHADEPFAGRFLVLWPANAPMHSVRPYLTAAARAGFHTALFTFTKRETQRRPILGTLTRVLATAARAGLLLGDDNSEVAGDHETDTVLVRAKDYATYDQLAQRVVSVRRAGKEVTIGL